MPRGESCGCMRNVRYFASALLLFTLGAAPVLSGEAGTVRSDALILLARTARSTGADPRDLRIDDVQISGDAASVRWTLGDRTNDLRLHRDDSRWFVDSDGMPSASWSGSPLNAGGGLFAPEAAQTGGYEIWLRYTRSNASPGARFSFVYGRAPTQAEFLPYPTTYPFSSESVFYYDLTIGDPKPVTFEPGSVLSVWFPFVLDDRIRYDMYVDGADRPIGPITTRVFDNTLSFELPAFTVTPGKTLVGEIDGNPH